MFQFVLIIALVSYANGSTLLRPAPLPDGKIVGGTTVDILDYPYQISLEHKDRHHCGGSIISENFVVTAAHCTRNTLQENLSVRAGSSLHGSNGSVVQIIAINQHPNYDNVKIDYDISVLKLASPLSFSNVIAPITLPSEHQEFAPGTSAVVTGWGRTTEGGLTSLQLQAVKVPLMSNSECQNAFTHHEITDRMLCAGIKEGGKDACQGDSGGPMAVDGVLVGIVSWGYGCARPHLPGVYASVPELRSYIAQVSGI